MVYGFGKKIKIRLRTNGWERVKSVCAGEDFGFVAQQLLLHKYSVEGVQWWMESKKKKKIGLNKDLDVPCVIFQSALPRVSLSGWVMLRG